MGDRYTQATKRQKLKSFRLSDLFFRARNDQGENSRSGLRRFGGDNGTSSFFQFRLEKREGGCMARIRGEERIVLFRSDRPGAIAKIIFSSTTPVQTSHESSPVKTSGTTGTVHSELKMAQAKIHVLDVKELYRGRDLGGLLFSEAMTILHNRYFAEGERGNDPNNTSRNLSHSSSVECCLDAEEDICRYNKLIHFYEELGCQVKQNAKIRYLNNNDGETYRKIPMSITLEHPKTASSTEGTSHTFNRKHSLLGNQDGFLPVELSVPGGNGASFKTLKVSSDGTTEGVHSSRKLFWLIVEDENGIHFRSTQGHRLVACPNKCIGFVESDQATIWEWEKFKVFRVNDNDGSISGSDTEDADSKVTQKELWMFQTEHGTYLATDPVSECVTCSRYPSYWQADGTTLKLQSTYDTPPRRQHYRKTWERQSVAYVQFMRESYFRFHLCRMGLKEAIDVLKNEKCRPFNVSSHGVTLRTFIFQFAEMLRKVGYPDWMQLVALLHEVGRVVKYIDTPMDGAEDYDWTISCKSRVVGCLPSQRTVFQEFRFLNRDLKDDRYNTSNGVYQENCGFENVLLLWTGPEYMYHMLKHNNLQIPDEGFAMLRLFSLKDWHCGEYSNLNNEFDRDNQSFVADFDQLRVQATKMSLNELSDNECDKLWDEYYSHICYKYGCDGDLSW